MVSDRAMRRRENRSHVSKKRMLQTRTHSEPPKTPVHSYHCIAQVSFAKPFPRMSHGNETSPLRYQYSAAIHTDTSMQYARAFGARFET